MAIQKKQDEFLWVEAYRPRTLDDIILPESILGPFRAMVEKGEISNMTLAGTGGVGKTTLARALAEDLGCDSLVINGSEESGIDVLRGKIRDFASTVSLGSDRPKVVILDEADYLNPQSTQPALRAFIEEFSKSCRFILTCNFRHKIIAPLHSRAPIIEFKLAKADRPKMAARFMKRLKEILAAEGVAYDEKVVAQVLTKHFPDYRRVLGELQRYAQQGSIDEGILAQVGDVDLAELLAALKGRDFKKMRAWVVNNIDNEPSAIFRRLYEVLPDKVSEVPQVVLLLADYGYKSAFCVDAEINLVACLTELMASVTFK